MGKPYNKKSIIAALNELDGLYESRTRIENKREKELAPHRQTFDEAALPINEKFDKQLSPVQERIAALENEVVAGILASEQEDGTLKLPLVEGDNYKAVASTTARRSVNPKTFFDSVKESERNSVFWGCFDVVLKHAEKLVGKNKLDSIATLIRKHRVSIEKKV